MIGAMIKALCKTIFEGIVEGGTEVGIWKAFGGRAFGEVIPTPKEPTDRSKVLNFIKALPDQDIAGLLMDEHKRRLEPRLGGTGKPGDANRFEIDMIHLYDSCQDDTEREEAFTRLALATLVPAELEQALQFLRNDDLSTWLRKTAVWGGDALDWLVRSPAAKTRNAQFWASMKQLITDTGTGAISIAHKVDDQLAPLASQTSAARNRARNKGGF